MDWEQLTYFRAIARHEHMGRAAEELAVSQSALSRSLARLEGRYGIRLFDRVKRGIRLNAFGSALLVRVERALMELENGDREIREMAGVAERQVALGFFGTLSARIVPDIIVRFQRRFPEARFRLFQGGFPMLRDRLKSGDIDLCLSSPRHWDPDLEWRPLWNEELVAVLPPDHPRAQSTHIDLRDLALEPMVALREGSGLRHDFDRLTQEAGFTPHIAFEGTEVGPLLGLVGGGFGVALIPKNVAESQSAAKIVPIRTPRCYRTIGLSWNKDRYFTTMISAFRDHIVEHQPEAGVLSVISGR